MVQYLLGDKLRKVHPDIDPAIKPRDPPQQILKNDGCNTKRLLCKLHAPVKFSVHLL